MQPSTCPSVQSFQEEGCHLKNLLWVKTHPCTVKTSDKNSNITGTRPRLCDRKNVRHFVLNMARCISHVLHHSPLQHSVRDTQPSTYRVVVPQNQGYLVDLTGDIALEHHLGWERLEQGLIQVN